MTSSRSPQKKFWEGKRVLVTGHTGFKGSWLGLWLTRLGATVSGLALAPEGEPNLFSTTRLADQISSHVCDINDPKHVADVLAQCSPEIVFHLAAQSLVLKGYESPEETFATNVVGTVNLLSRLRDCSSLRVVVVVTTDKVYRNMEQQLRFRESDELAGHDPYSASKAACEIAVEAMRKSYFAGKVAISTVRAGNVIGGGDWAQNRIIPDAVRAWSKDTSLFVRNPQAIRPWQHVIEPLAGYLVLAEKMYFDADLAQAFNFGPKDQEPASVRTVVELARSCFGKGNVEFGPGNAGPHEAGVLMLDSSLAEHELGFVPRWGIGKTIERTMKWYTGYESGLDPAGLCLSDIAEYESSDVVV